MPLYVLQLYIYIAMVPFYGAFVFETKLAFYGAVQEFLFLIISELEFLQHRGTNSGVRSWTASSIGTCQASIFPTSLNASHMEKSI